MGHACVTPAEQGFPPTAPSAGTCSPGLCGPPPAQWGRPSCSRCGAWSESGEPPRGRGSGLVTAPPLKPPGNARVPSCPRGEEINTGRGGRGCRALGGLPQAPGEKRGSRSRSPTASAHGRPAGHSKVLCAALEARVFDGCVGVGAGHCSFVRTAHLNRVTQELRQDVGAGGAPGDPILRPGSGNHLLFRNLDSVPA